MHVGRAMAEAQWLRATEQPHTSTSSRIAPALFRNQPAQRWVGLPVDRAVVTRIIIGTHRERDFGYDSRKLASIDALARTGPVAR